MSEPAEPADRADFLVRAGHVTSARTAEEAAQSLGVEVGQVSVVLCVLGVAALLIKLNLAMPRRLVVDLASAALVGIGLYWFLGRAYV